MPINSALLTKLPFPYFFIDRDLKVLSSSEIMPYDFSFLNLFDHLAADQFAKFLFDSPANSSVEIKLHIEGRFAHRVYKLEADFEGFHLFCFPIAAENVEQNVAHRVETKLGSINEQVIQKKKLVKKKIQEIQDASISSDHLADIGTLAAGIAHEIRNPLTTVKGFIQLLKPSLAEIGKEHYADVALEEINRANDIIHEFLNAAKPQVNKKQPIHLNKIVKDMVTLFESESILRNIAFTADFSAEDPGLFIDVKQLKQVLVNMIKNALEAIEERHGQTQGTIHLKTERTKEGAAISITDNGAGIAHETIEQLFQPFRSTKENGTGIGLAISKKMIDEHSGKIHVKSTPGIGTTFIIELPVIHT